MEVLLVKLELVMRPETEFLQIIRLIMTVVSHFTSMTWHCGNFLGHVGVGHEAKDPFLTGNRAHYDSHVTHHKTTA